MTIDFFSVVGIIVFGFGSAHWLKQALLRCKLNSLGTFVTIICHLAATFYQLIMKFYSPHWVNMFSNDNVLGILPQVDSLQPRLDRQPSRL